MTVSNLYSSYVQREEFVYVHATYCHVLEMSRLRVGSGERSLIIGRGKKKRCKRGHLIHMQYM